MSVARVAIAVAGAADGGDGLRAPRRGGDRAARAAHGRAERPDDEDVLRLAGVTADDVPAVSRPQDPRDLDLDEGEQRRGAHAGRSAHARAVGGVVPAGLRDGLRRAPGRGLPRPRLAAAFGARLVTLIDQRLGWIGTTGLRMRPRPETRRSHWSGRSMLTASLVVGLEAEVDVVPVIGHRVGVVGPGVLHERDDLRGLHRALQRQQRPDGAVGDRAGALVAGDRDAVDRGDVDRVARLEWWETLPLAVKKPWPQRSEVIVGFMPRAARNEIEARTRRSTMPARMSARPQE